MKPYWQTAINHRDAGYFENTKYNIRFCFTFHIPLTYKTGDRTQDFSASEMHRTRVFTILLHLFYCILPIGDRIIIRRETLLLS